MSKHTPGPWAVEDGGKHGGLRIHDEDGLTIAEVWGFAAPDREGEEPANAAVLAAAPALLDALRALVTAEDEWTATTGIRHAGGDQITDAVDAARAALAKAEPQ